MSMTVASIHALSARLCEIGVPDTTEVFVGCPDSGIPGAPEPVEPIIGIVVYENNGDDTNSHFICLDIGDPENPTNTNVNEDIASLKLS